MDIRRTIDTTADMGRAGPESLLSKCLPYPAEPVNILISENYFLIRL